MNDEKLKQEWRVMAPLWIEKVRAGDDPNRSGLLDDFMLDVCGDVGELTVLDCGCGEGRFSRMMVERGAASVLGIDLCEPMVVAAQELQTDRDRYRVADAQDLGFIEDESFDLVVSYLNQCDLPDFEANNREVYRVLKPSGRFVIANLHPMRSAVGKWAKNDAGEKQHIVLDQYFDETERLWPWRGLDFTNFHRSLSTYINQFLQTGFVIEQLIEPTARPEQLDQYPELVDELRVPNFIIYALSKPRM